MSPLTVRTPDSLTLTTRSTTTVTAYYGTAAYGTAVYGIGATLTPRSTGSLTLTPR